MFYKSQNYGTISTQIYLKLMKLFAAIVFTYLVFIPESVNAATIKQDFTLTVTKLGMDDISNTPLLKIGDKGIGSFLYDTNDLHFINDPSYPVGTYLGSPGNRNIAFKDFSIDFNGHHFTKLIDLNGRIGSIFLFNPDSFGNLKPYQMILSTGDDTATIVTARTDSRFHGFSYANIPNFTTSTKAYNGVLEFTESRSIPEPSTIFGSTLISAYIVLSKYQRSKVKAISSKN